ncbi:MAG: PRC-barrel domain-containing protein [Balneolales bacterium]
MKTSKINLSTLAMAVLCLALFTWIPVQSISAQQEGQQNEKQSAQLGEEGEGKKGQKGTELTGKSVVDSEGNQLGTISDVAVSLQNSRIAYVMISDENGGMAQDPMQGDPMEQDQEQQDQQQDQQQQGQGMQAGQLKAVPPQALSESGEGEFQLDIDQQKWAEAPTFDKQELAQSGLDDQQGQEIYAFYDQEWSTGDLTLLEEQGDQQEDMMPQDDQQQGNPQQEPESGPAPSDTTEHQQDEGMAQQEEQPQPTQDQQTGNNELVYFDDLEGKSVSTQQDEEIGEVDEFLLDMEEGRLAFVVVSASGMGQQDQQGGLGQQQQDQQQQDDQQQGQQQQETPGQGQEAGDLYAIIPNALQYDREQDRVTVDIEKQEIEQAETISSDEWVDPNMEELGYAEVFRYEESGTQSGSEGNPLGQQQQMPREEDSDREPNGGESQMQDQQQEQSDDRSAQQGRKGHKASDLQGQDVVNQDGESLGTIEDLAVDLQNSRVTYAVIAEGGILGVGEELKVVPPQALSFSSEEENYVLDIDEERWAEAPTFEDKQEIAQAANEAQAQEIYAFFGEEFQSEDLGFLGEQMTAPEQNGAQEDEPEGGASGPAAAQDQQGQQQQQEMGEELQFTEELSGMTVTSQQAAQPDQQPEQPDQQEEGQQDQQEGMQSAQQEVGEVDEFLVDLEEGRLAFVVLNVSEDFISQENGMGAGQPQEGQPQEDQSQQEGQAQAGGNMYAVAPSALSYSQEEEQLTLDIDRQEFMQAESIDSETWIDEDREMLGQNRVFRYEEQSGNGEWGAAESEGYREENGTRQDGESNNNNNNNEATTGQEAGVVQNEMDDQQINQPRGAKASELLGDDIVNQEDANLGSLNDLAIHLQNNRIVYAVVRGGGFLGIGASLRAVPPQAIQHRPEQEQLIINIDEERWGDAPTYDKEELAEMTDETQGGEIYAFFNQEWDDSDLALLEDGAGASQQGPDINNNSNPSPPGIIEQQDEQESPAETDDERLVFADNLLGSNIMGTDQGDIGDVEDFLIDLEEGRAAFVVVTLDENFVGQSNDRTGMDNGADFEDNNDDGTDQREGQDMNGQQQQGAQENGGAMGNENNRFAIMTSAFRLSAEDELMLGQIDQSEFEQAESLDERWMEMDMDIMAENRVFRFQESDNGASDQMSNDQDQPENGIFRDNDGDQE